MVADQVADQFCACIGTDFTDTNLYGTLVEEKVLAGRAVVLRLLNGRAAKCKGYGVCGVVWDGVEVCWRDQSARAPAQSAVMVNVDLTDANTR
jgi:hypothetical protein